MFKFRNNVELIGVILGTICFVPSFIIALMIGILKNMMLSLIVLLISQCLWITSIGLCTTSVQMENKILRDRLEELDKSS